MERPGTRYRTHLETALPALLAAGLARPEELESHTEAVENLLLLDFERVRGSLDSLLPKRRGGRPPFDQVVMVRSLFLAVMLEKGRFNAWGRRLGRSPLMRVLIGLEHDVKAPSIGAHYHFAQRLLRSADADGTLSVEHKGGHGGRFERNLRPDPETAKKPEDNVCENMRKRLLNIGDKPLPMSLDSVLIDWIVDVGMRCLVDHGVIGVGAIDLSVDGTVHRSHASERGRAIPGREPVPDVAPAEEIPAATAPTAEPAAPARNKNAVEKRAAKRAKLDDQRDKRLKRTADAAAREKRKAAKQKAKKKAKPPTSGLRHRAKATHGPRHYSDPSATFRYSTASDSLEFGHLGLGGTIRVGNLDIPVFSAFADSRSGETPMTMRATHQFRMSLANHLPDIFVRSFIGDAGFDIAAMYRNCDDAGMVPIIARNHSLVLIDDTIRRGTDGTTPLCPGGVNMKLHITDMNSLCYRCIAKEYTKRANELGSHYNFNADLCPLGAPCSDTASGPFITILKGDNPRLNIPVSRDSETFRLRMNERTAIERHFGHQHNAIPDRTYRRQHLWQLACAMHTMGRQASVARAAARADLDGFWARVLPAEAAAAA